jgi:predicted HTH transcriptional regulator
MKIETDQIEYKSDLSSENNVKAEIVSFLNSKTGGVIYLGANNDGSPVKFGSEAEKHAVYSEWEEKLANWIAEAFSPEVIGLISVDPTTEPMTIRVSPGPNRPYYYTKGRGFNPKGVYIRIGSSKRAASDDEIKRMMISGVANLYEQQTSSFDSLDFDYVIKRLAGLGIEFNEFGLEIRKPNEKYRNVGLLISEINPFSTKIAVYEGLIVDVFLDKKEYTGSIPEQIDKVMDYMKLAIRERNIVTGMPQRTVLPDYPMKAIREAILNCYCHRDWTINAEIRIEVFDDRIKVMSPGGAPDGLSIEEIKMGATAKRNPILVKALDKMDYIENYNSGIQRILNEYDGFPLQPSFYAGEDVFTVILYNKNHYYDNLKKEKPSDGTAIINAKVEREYTKTDEEILDLIKRDRTVTAKQIAEVTSKHRVTISKSLKKLQDTGVIERVGSKKAGYWKVNE